MKEVISVIKSIRSLNKEDKDRLLECFYCAFYKECEETVETPVDNEDGTCKTKQEFNNRWKGLLR